MDALARTPTARIERFTGADRWVVGAAVTHARALVMSTEHALDASAVVDWDALASHAALPAYPRAWGWLTIADLHLSAGSARRALIAADNARLAAAAADDSCRGVRVRAIAISAACRALNGEYDKARDATAFHEGPQKASPESAGEDLFFLGAQTLLARADADVPALHACADALTNVPAVGNTDPALADLARASAHLFDGKPVEASSLALRVLHGTGDLRAVPVIQALGIDCLVQSLLVRNEPIRALAALSNPPELVEHVICFNALRAAAYLAIGWWGEALHATDECIRAERGHALRTLSSVFLTRAIALHRMGHIGPADTFFADGFALVRALGSVTEMLFLPTHDIDLLLDRAESETADAREGLDELRSRFSSPGPDLITPRFLPLLSDREKVILQFLLTQTSIADIAAQLYVSVNTVKTQTQAIYRKSGVQSRKELVELLESLGVPGSVMFL